MLPLRFIFCSPNAIHLHFLIVNVTAEEQSFIDLTDAPTVKHNAVKDATASEDSTLAEPTGS